MTITVISGPNFTDGVVHVEQRHRRTILGVHRLGHAEVSLRPREVEVLVQALSALPDSARGSGSEWVEPTPRHVRVGAAQGVMLVEVRGVAAALRRHDAQRLRDALAAGKPKPAAGGGISLPEAIAALEEVAAIVDPDWVRGRVLPQVMGAADMARVRAIQIVVEDALADRGGRG